MFESKTDLSKQDQGTVYRQWFVAMSINSTMLTYGIQTGWISPMTKVLQSDQSPTGHPMSETDLSWIASIACLIAAFGTPLYTYVADTFGRRAAVILIAVSQLLCWLIKFSSANTAILVTARVFSGLAAGGCFNMVSIYVKEISRDDIRGLTGSLMMLFQNIGILFMYIIGAYLDYFTVLWIVVWMPVATVLLMLKVPESPSYLVKIGKTEEAISTIAWLRGVNEEDKAVQIELNSISNEKHVVESLPNISYFSLFRQQSWRTGILLMLSIMTLCSLNGCFAILTYASSILGSSGVTVSPELQSMSFPTLMVIGGLISMACVERFGRKPLIAVTTFLISASMLGLGAVIYTQSHGSSIPGWLPATLMMTAVSSYSTGAGPVPYIMMSEMFNFRIRAKVLGLIVSYGWFINFVQLLAYAPMAAAFGAHNVFFGFGALNFLAFVVSIVLLPETKGKSVEEIEAGF